VRRVILQVIIILTFLAVFDDHTPSGRDLKPYNVISVHVILVIHGSSQKWLNHTHVLEREAEDYLKKL
jgi:hypothetical protein